MSDSLICWKCGHALEDMPMPLRRRDECPACGTDLHVCRMCEFFDPDVPKQCCEDDAEEVFEKERLNFCEWFKPSSNAFDPQRAAEDSRARDELAALFGEEEAEKPDDDALRKEAEDLFK